MTQDSIIDKLYDSIGVNPHSVCGRRDVAHVEVHQNKVLGVHLVPGLKVDATEKDKGIEARISVEKGVRIGNPVHICFGVMPEKGQQEIDLDIDIEDSAQVGVLAYCSFPFARQVIHRMDANIRVGKGAEYGYFERHVHGGEGGVTVIPRSRVEVLEGGRFSTEFELIKGRAGSIDIDLETVCRARSVMDVTARISARGNDKITINETGRLIGERATGALTSHIALRDSAQAEVRNTLTASAPFARGHVDCKEIVQGSAVARAVPIVEVNHPQAHVTHEAAIGSVDSKQLETLMSRGLTEDEATELIIQGLLSR
ncbi:MAG: SufD family Fe-S cluster assembly protein [Kiritimatiellia bacterium]